MINFRGFIVFGKQKIPYDVLYADRKTMEIAVHPNCRVLIKSPMGTAPEKIRARLVKRARWISKQIAYFRAFEPRIPARRYLGGETHLFLGRQYRLKIRAHKAGTVKLKGSHFFVETLHPRDPIKIKSLLDEWYKEHAHVIFSRRLKECYRRAKRLKAPYPKIRLRKMDRRWGSCSKSGDILLNTHLVKAPISSIDYVIMHELCHLKVHTHNNGYFKLLSKYMPDWKIRKERLEKAMI